LVAVPAINRLIAVGFERHGGIDATRMADRGIHLTFSALVSAPATMVLSFFSGAASRAATRFVGESFGRKEFLFVGSENEISATVFTG
jgi:hypothetical protein